MKKPCAAQGNETFCEGCGERVAVCGEVLSVKDAKMSTSLRLSWLASVLKDCRSNFRRWLHLKEVRKNEFNQKIGDNNYA